MAVLIVALVIGVFVTWKFYADTAWGGFELLPLIGGLAVGFFMFVVTLFLLEGIINGFLPKHEITASQPLVAIQDGSSLQGSFFLGSGYVDSKPTYTYYVKVGDAYRLQSTPADGVDLHQDNSPPRVVSVTNCKWDFDWLAECLMAEEVKSIFVPQGTISQNYVLGPNAN